MAGLARLTLADGSSILIEAAEVTDGPVKAGRLSEVVHDLPGSLQDALVPVKEAARIILAELRQAGPSQVEVEFGVDLAVQAGAVITKTGVGAHLKVTLAWKDSSDSAASERQRA
jgi:hypothetical protein